jgi:hypothetical protein
MKDQINALDEIGVTQVAINAANESADEFRDIAQRAARLSGN